ncbi:hypothetical protein [Sphingomonas sp. CCH5-D11]|uniref:hypothetical protein n=1 Tax=Sphingomonas sp. CCH5-D11 TaxID=1768786 RepID=UPI000834E349|nr:hypothetical protein [Sphingomonas sp. CCH5-D11]
MRLATTVSAALIALSTAALAQVADPSASQEGNIMSNGSTPANSTQMDPATTTGTDPNDPSQNMLSNSASPPPTEPK